MEEENKNPASTQEGTTVNQNPPDETVKQTTEGGSADGGKTEGNETKTSTEGASTNPETKPKEEQSKEDNAKFAAMRHQKEVEKAKAAGDAEGYKRARIKSVGGKNPYAGDSPIETDEDYELYELQDEIKQKGGDPSNVLEVDKLRREKAEAAKKVAEENKANEEKNQERADNEVNDYLKEGHTREELQGYWNDKKFQEFASDLLGLVPLKTIIAKYDKAYPKGTNEGKKEAANKISNPGSATNSEVPDTPKKIGEMNQTEFKKYFEEVKAGKRKL